MDKNYLEIKNYVGEDYVLSSVDLIAVMCGSKRSTRVECMSVEDFKEKDKDFKKHELVAVPSDKKLFGKFNVYISKSKKYALEAKKCDPSFKIINGGKSFNDTIGDVKKFSDVISYPACCIREHIESTLQNTILGESKMFLDIPRRIPFVFNNILNGVSNIFLSFHVPCSFSCDKTFAHNQKIFDAIQKVSPLFARTIKDLLNRPYLIFLHPSKTTYTSWDQRKGFLFDGFVKNDELVYSEALYFETNYPDYEKNKNTNDFISVVKIIQGGNRIKFNDKGFTVYRNKKLSGRFVGSKELKDYLFNFF